MRDFKKGEKMREKPPLEELPLAVRNGLLAQLSASELRVFQSSLKEVEKSHFKAEKSKLELGLAERKLIDYEANEAKAAKAAKSVKPLGSPQLAAPRSEVSVEELAESARWDRLIQVESAGSLGPERRRVGGPHVSPRGESRHGDLIQEVDKGKRRLDRQMEAVSACAGRSLFLAQGYSERLGSSSFSRLVSWLDTLKDTGGQGGGMGGAPSKEFWEIFIEANLEADEKEPPPWSAQEGLDLFEREKGKGNRLCHDFRWGQRSPSRKGVGD